LANSTLVYLKAYSKLWIVYENRKQEVVYLPEGHTTHYREELSPKRENDANHPQRAQQAPKRVGEHRGVLPIHQPETGTGNDLDRRLKSFLEIKNPTPTRSFFGCLDTNNWT
jgi:hypothetical protein